MSQPFSFPPPPPPPPQRETTTSADFRGGNRGRGNDARGHSSRGFGQAQRGRGSYGNQTFQQRGRGGFTQRYGTAAPKRDFSTAFAHQPQTRPRAPPAVPSFDLDIKNLVSSPQRIPPSEATKKKGNLLGLTPTNQDASESEDDADDETKLTAEGSSGGLQFEHKGYKLSLRTPGEIATWLAERRKKYPTQAKVEVAKQEANARQEQWQEQKRARDEASKLKRQAREAERSERERQRLKEKAIAVQVAKAKMAVADSKADVATDAREKAEKLRKRAERAARDLRLAEEQLRHLEGSAIRSDAEGANITLEVDDEDDAESTKNESDSVDSDTSSSGSSESDSAPEEATSKRTEPESVILQPHMSRGDSDDGPPICKNLLKFGRCKFGKRCRFSHKLKKERSKPSTVASGRRKGLYQVMVDKEREEELQRALQAIIALGDGGLLDDPQHIKAAGNTTLNNAGTGITDLDALK